MTEPGGITDDEAERIVDTLLSFGERVERLNRQHAIRLERLEREHARFVEDWQGHLDDWIAAQLIGRRERYVDLPTGRVGMRRQPARVEVAKADELVEWLAEEGREDLFRRFVEVPDPAPRVKRAEVARHFAGARELPPGVREVEARDKVYVAAPKKGGA